MAEKKIAYLLLEVGMGGGLDATNVVQSLYAVITNVGLEHQEWLGDTLEKIATHKAGIIKKGKTIIADNGVELLSAVTRQTTTYVNVLKKYQIAIELEDKKFKTKVCISTGSGVVLNTFELGLYGKFQAYNFLIAYELLNDMGIDLASIKFAAQNTYIPWRCQIIAHNPLIIYDMVHNVSGANALVASLAHKYNPDDVVFVTAILGDKDICQMLQIFSAVTSNIIFTSIANNPRAISANSLNAMAADLFKNKYAIDDSKKALQFAKALAKKMIVVCGSSYIFQKLS